MMNKYTSLLQKYLKILIFTSLILSLFLGFGLLFRTSQTLETTAVQDATDYKSAFFQAMQANDLGKGRDAYEALKKILPADDPFLTEIAPAYLADLYIKYAKVLQYDKKSSELMISRAKQLIPQHPAVLAMEQSTADVAPVQDAPVIDVAQVEAPVELPIIHEENQEVSDGPPRIPYIDPPPLLGFSAEPEYTLQPEVIQPEPEAVAAPAQLASTPPTNDPCSLSYLTKTHALTACIDSVAANRFGPALFVVGDKQNQPKLAFMQQPMTHQDYQVFCDLAGQCYEDVEETLPLIDLSDVQETVQDYNAYCQMSGTCDKIEAQSKVTQKPLTRGQAQRYALWLSKTTGYKYRLVSDQDAQLIQQYFQDCVASKECSSGVINSLANLMSKPDLLLVRELDN